VPLEEPERVCQCLRGRFSREHLAGEDLRRRVADRADELRATCFDRADQVGHEARPSRLTRVDSRAISRKFGMMSRAGISGDCSRSIIAAMAARPISAHG